MDWRRGDIVGVNLNPKKGEEVDKVRPCIIISDDMSNHILDTVTVVPLSSQLVDDMAPFRLRLPKTEGVHQTSDILVNHIRTLSKRRITSKIGRIDETTYTRIYDALCQLFQPEKALYDR
jgi:mRNA interferase MazF